MQDPIIPDVLSPEATEASREVVHTAKNAAQAIETARAVQMAALNESTTKSLIDALREVFGEQETQQRFIDTKRIPLICKQIENIHSNIEEIKAMFKEGDERYINTDQFWPVKTIVYGMVAILLTGMVGAFVLLVIK